MHWLILTLLLLAAAIKPSQVSHSVVRSKDPTNKRDDQPDSAFSYMPAQAIAQNRANYMASRGLRGHPPIVPGMDWLSVPGACFEGVGWSRFQRSRAKISTCRPSGRSSPEDDNSRTLVGDAAARSRLGTFRVRIWAND